MLLLKFFKEESSEPKFSIIFMSVVAGISSSLILAIINTAAAMMSTPNAALEVELFFAYVIASILFAYGRNHALSRATVVVEDALCKVRLRIADKIRHSDLSFMEKLGKPEVFTKLTQETNLISQSALLVTNAMQATVIVFFSMLYIAFLSFNAFVVMVVSVVMAMIVYQYYHHSINEDLRQTALKEEQFFRILEHELDGFKEIKVNRSKSAALYQDIKQVSDETEVIKVRSGLKFVVQFLFSRIFFNTLLGVLVFILPVFSPTHSIELIKITAAVLFIVGPLEAIASTIPEYSRASMAVKGILDLEKKLDEESAKHATQQKTLDTISECFDKIEFQKLHFQYTDSDGKPTFAVGPLDLTVRQGELLFIVGGNGSGKSTFLKLITGLYYPYAGKIKVDDELIDQHSYPAYRDLFAIIFTDFHLFDKFYGLEKVDEKRVRAMIDLMELSEKTKFIEGRFTHMNLSTGQRKRLAYIAAILDDKPIYILDEFAADQDPIFRRYFYETLLPDLCNSGKTVIAVTHDDKYFSIADRILKMEYGQLVEYQD